MLRINFFFSGNVIRGPVIRLSNIQHAGIVHVHYITGNVVNLTALIFCLSLLSSPLSSFLFPFHLSHLPSPAPSQTVFHSQLFTEGLKEARVAILKYVVHNMATSLPLSQLPEHLHYSITDTSGQWKIQDSQNGALKTPTSGKSEQICIQAVPSKSGTLIPPKMTLSVPRVGSKVEALDSSVIEMVTLTPAEVYELSLGETITVG